MFKEMFRKSKEAVTLAAKPRSRLLVIAALAAASVGCGISGVKDRGIRLSFKEPNGEGTYYGLHLTDKGLRLRTIDRYGGTKPVPCEMEAPLVYTEFTELVRDRFFNLTEQGTEWSSGRISADPNNPCQPLPWE